ncbi:hypothetical protein G7Z17_g3594 [Cylindrodendrum hubeiense]|uniref:Uncharacterized protein n=1 Tax=Cylindrodendrum hubeiense TaxID=595255 RepID=A0A9P5LAM3_9HYPO|nr:hypothetical protein G7Z17_g3594 [Cylindrodendrum hubeiense]
MTKILDILTKPNVDIDSSQVSPGTKISIENALGPEDWKPWTGFEYSTLSGIFNWDLSKDCHGSAEQVPLLKDNDTLEDVLDRFEIPIVNCCLGSQTGTAHLVRKNSGESANCKPDWSTVSRSHLDAHSCFKNILPGYTKLNNTLRSNIKEGSKREWQSAIVTIMTYMAYHGSRYGFIITDGCLVALRITRKPTGPEISNESIRHSTAAPSSYPIELSPRGDNPPDYEDNDPLQWEYMRPEYVIIPWGASGPGQLTIKLALWFLAMMSTNGDRHIDYSYPSLDSWRWDRNGFVHNTSGARKYQLFPGDMFQDRDPEKMARHERQAQDAQNRQQLQLEWEAPGHTGPRIVYDFQSEGRYAGCSGVRRPKEERLSRASGSSKTGERVGKSAARTILTCLGAALQAMAFS